MAVWDSSAGWAPDHSEVELADGKLTATKVAVPDADGADLLIVAGADRRHYLVETDAPGVEVAAEKPLDPTRRLFTVELQQAPATPPAPTRQPGSRPADGLPQTRAALPAGDGARRRA